MLKRLKSVSMMLFLMGASTGAAYAVANPGITDVKITQQSGSCTGVVKDAMGETVIGASVVVKGSTNGTITDFDGNFSLSGVKKGDIIVISFVGYQTQEVVWNGQPMSITLKDDTQALEEVVVVGYGTQKKVNVTGAVSMVGAEALESRPVANVTQALQGAVPGLNLSVGNNGGDLNAGMSINIRGTGSIGNGSVDSPLVLIDGIEGNINLLNPNDVESVSVLKDAASASIYGARAAFGVILITTKSGKAGKVKVNYSGDIRFSTATQLPDMMNSLDFANFFNTASINSGGGAQYNEETMANLIKYLNGEFTDPTQPEYYGTTANTAENKWNNYTSAFANTDWFEEHYKKNVPSTQHNLSLSGGNEKLNWSISGSYLLNNGLIRHGHDELNRYTMNGKIGAQLADWVRVEYSTKWSRKDYEKPQYFDQNFFHNICRRWPTCPVIDPNGYYMNEMEIYELEQGGTDTQRTDQFTQQLKFVFTPLEGWTIHAEGALRTEFQERRRSRIPVYYYGVDGTPMLRNSDYGTVTNVYENRFSQDYYALNLFTDYTRSFGKHNGKVLVGVNFEKYTQGNLWGQGYNLTSSDKPYLSQTQDNKTLGDSFYHRATAGYFGRLNYDYDGKYLLEANIRYDGSSRFLADKRWAWFPSFSVGWNIAREDFFEKLSETVSTLKLRASWGQLGNTSSSYNSFADYYPFFLQQSVSSASSAWLINGNKLNTASMPGVVNGLMTWETVETWDIGFDFGAFNNRLTGSFDWYSRTTKDMIGPAPVLGSVLGINAPRTNNCDMRTTGWEFEISWRDQINDFKYGARFNISDNTAKILNYPYDGDFENQSITGYYNGKQLGEIWGYESAGIAQTDEQMTEWLVNNNPNFGGNWTAGDIMYKDLNDDKIVSTGSGTLGNHGDLKVIGNSTARYRVGLNLDASYKGWDFSVFFQGVLKRDWMFGESDPYFWGTVDNKWQSTGFVEHLDYWREDNPGAYYPKPYLTGGGNKNHKAQDRYLQSAAYVRCKNIQLGYTFPQKWMAPAGIENLRLYASIDNLFTITGLSSVYDPEAFGGYNGAFTSGKTYPLQRTISFGVNVSF